MIKKIFSVSLIVFITSCMTYPKELPPDSKEMWTRKNTSEADINNEINKCGFYKVIESEDFVYDDMAKVHICMIKKGFFYKPGIAHFCSEFGYLPSCEEAYKNGILW